MTTPSTTRLWSVTSLLKLGLGTSGRVLHHTCERRACVNPAHLFLGTVGDNNRDRHQKGRRRGLFASSSDHPATRRRGERHWRAKLTADDVVAIRVRREAGELCRVIAADFGINEGTVSRIARRVWRQEVQA